MSFSMVTMWKDRPFLTYSATHPKYLNQGLSTNLIKSSINALLMNGHEDLYLIVTNFIRSCIFSIIPFYRMKYTSSNLVCLFSPLFISDFNSSIVIDCSGIPKNSIYNKSGFIIIYFLACEAIINIKIKK